MGSLPVSQLLPSTGHCPALTPPLSGLDQGPFMAVLMLDHPTSTPSSLPTSPPSLHLLHCMRHYLASARTFSPFLLSTLSPNATHQALCSMEWGPHWSRSAMSVVPSMALWLQKCLGHQQVVGCASRPPHLDLLTAEVWGDLRGCGTGRRALQSQQMAMKPCMWEGWSGGHMVTRPYDGVWGWISRRQLQELVRISIILLNVWGLNDTLKTMPLSKCVIS
ncbi:unnamed protein product [Rangifer tarandus platyrhynchus]|uniref:Uncharacterized protein n=1 Tax=Rangifer tarandus platyrhynchus TaxID=3082113 RepID=A0ABN8YI28_RANTA|nr:unnamed protein product [Rangifer tarandus platyrhynchus]